VHAERLIPVTWGPPRASAQGKAPLYPVNVTLLAHDRQGLLRDISEVFAKENMNVVGVHTQSLKGSAQMTFTVEVADTRRLQAMLSLLQQVQGVVSAQRR